MMARNPGGQDTDPTVRTGARRRSSLHPLRDPGVSARTPRPHGAGPGGESPEKTKAAPVEPAPGDTMRLPPGWRRSGDYGLALLFVAVATLFRWALPQVLEPAPTLVFYLAWVGAAAFGGLGPGLLATVASWLCMELLFEPPPGQISFADPTSIGRLAILLVGGLVVSVVGEKMRRSRIRERRQRRELGSANAQLQAKTGELLAANEELRAREQALAESEEKYRRIVETATEAIVIADAEARIIFINDRWSEFVGYSREEAGQMTLFDLVFPEDLALAKERWESRKRGRKERYEFRLRCKDGSVIWALLSMAPHSGPTGEFLGELIMAVDITQRRQAEEALAESRKKYRGLVERINDWAWEVDANCVYTYASPRALELLGYAPEEIVGKTPFDLMPPDEATRVWNAFEPIWRERTPFELLENTLVRQDGRLVTVETSGMPLFAEDGTFRGYTGIDRDVTSRKQAEEARRRSEEQFHQLFEDDLTGDFISTPEGEILLCNPAFARIFGFSRAVDAVGTNIVDLYLDPRERQPLLERLQQEGKLERLEVWRRRRDGEPIYIVENVVGRFDEQGRLSAIKGYLFEDTQRKRAEEALRELMATLESRVVERTEELEHRARQLQKLTLELSETEERERERVAAVLHDDLQQVLAAAKFHLSRVSGGTASPEQSRKVVVEVKEMLKDAIEKSRHLSHELSPAVLRQGDLAEIFDWLAGQMQTQHGLAVRVEVGGGVHARSDAVKAFMYRSAQEMLFNVVKHAEVKEARVRVRRRGQYLCLSVSDRGRGFDPGEIQKTTGFGLLSIRERVALLGGRMKARSARGRGTTFRVVVPDAELLANGAPLE
jgi:PAS domain S-box-containing protein